MARDRQVTWHPATHFVDQELMPALPIARAQGAYLETPSGALIFDAISSWWTCLHGHGHPHIARALSRQFEALDHVMFAGFTHGPAICLSEQLIARAPAPQAPYARVFYADCGSAAVEVALKMSLQYRQQSGEPERLGLATLSNSYHGETLGALAVSGNAAYRERFQSLLFPTLTLPVPAGEQHQLADLETGRGEDAEETERAIQLLTEHAPRLTALLIEPVIQCAGRMVMPGVGMYRALVSAAQRLGIHVIADEIAVGFGRTGRLFASEWGRPGESAVQPDFLCLSKGLSGGVLPLSAVLVRAGIDAAFEGEPARSFLHSHTFTANPLACAAALASLELFDREGTLERVATLSRTLERLRCQVAVAAGPIVTAQRQAGLVAALCLTPPESWSSPAGPGRLGLALRGEALRRGVLLRPLHDTIYWMPPYCVSEAELERLADVTLECIRAVVP